MGTDANERIRLGFIGTGNMGMLNLKAFLKRADVEILAVCDVDTRHAAAGKAAVDEAAGNDACTVFGDFRELHRAGVVDAVVITTPDHWHALQAVDAARCGLDVYLEKPLTLTIAEGRAICRAVAETGCVLQAGTQQRSSEEFRRACELIRNGCIGAVRVIDIEIPGNNRTCEPTWEPMPVPPELNYDLWLGPAPAVPYHKQRCHYEFRFIRDYSGGQVTNWGAHHIDIAHWALDMDRSGPVRARGTATYPEAGLFNTATEVDFELTYPNGTVLTCRTGGNRIRFIGENGTISVRRGKIEADPEAILATELGPAAVALYRSDDHHGNWIDCIRTREEPVSPAETAHRSGTACHLANIAMQLGRELAWDPKTETFPNDPEAQALVKRPVRAPWDAD